ncbi:MAG: carbohydrate ABC transporter permease [Firmicutes bacterium]|nr:carbohydrate ABC transporter permease [Bacillota bacterium]
MGQRNIDGKLKTLTAKSSPVRRLQNLRAIRAAAFTYAGALLLGLLILAPFLWLFITSISPRYELAAAPPHWAPQHPTFLNYQKLLNPSGSAAFTSGEIPPFGEAFKNSLAVAVAVTLVCLLLGSLAAYALARARSRSADRLIYLTIGLRMVPEISLVIPLYILLRRFGLIDTRFGLFLVYASFTLPFVIWIMQGYFRTIPRELEEAAAIDGCSRSQALLRIVAPLSLPGMVATGLFTFLLAWDEFLFALLFTATYSSKTITVAISEFTTRHLIDYGLMATGGILAAIPPVLIALVFQKKIIQGLTAGAVKG